MRGSTADNDIQTTDVKGKVLTDRQHILLLAMSVHCVMGTGQMIVNVSWGLGGGI